MWRKRHQQIHINMFLLHPYVQVASLQNDGSRMYVICTEIQANHLQEHKLMYEQVETALNLQTWMNVTVFLVWSDKVLHVNSSDTKSKSHRCVTMWNYIRQEMSPSQVKVFVFNLAQSSDWYINPYELHFVCTVVRQHNHQKTGSTSYQLISHFCF